jgi:hypothetical protein
MSSFNPLFCSVSDPFPYFPLLKMGEGGWFGSYFAGNCAFRMSRFVRAFPDDYIISKISPNLLQIA